MCRAVPGPIDGVSASIRNCVFRSHVNTGGRGAAIFVRNGTLLLENSLVYFNGGPGSGTAMEMENGGGLILNSLFHDNENGGLRFGTGSRPTVLNTIFAVNLGRGVWHEGPADTPTFTNCCSSTTAERLAGQTTSNQGTTLNTAAEINALAFADGCLVADPRFASMAASDYHLLPTSPSHRRRHDRVCDAGAAARLLRQLAPSRRQPRRHDAPRHRAARVRQHHVLDHDARRPRPHPPDDRRHGRPALDRHAHRRRDPAGAHRPGGVLLAQPLAADRLLRRTDPAEPDLRHPAGDPERHGVDRQAFTVGGTGGINLSGLGDSEVQ